MAVRLFVGGFAHKVQGQPAVFGGDRMYSPCYHGGAFLPRESCIMQDSGAFTDPVDKRLTYPDALKRQLDWEAKMMKFWGREIVSDFLVSYDLLIDETWVGGVRHKARWSVEDARHAVDETVGAAAYLASLRDTLAPSRLVLSCQGVDAHQYADCAERVLRHAAPADVLGLGGWCIVGMWRSWLPEFWRTIQLVLPMAHDAGIRQVHIFGVLWRPALGPLLWLADQYGIRVSTDSTAPVLQATWKNWRKAGAIDPYWRRNVAAHLERLENLRDSRYYAPMPRQLDLWDVGVASDMADGGTV